MVVVNSIVAIVSLIVAAGSIAYNVWKCTQSTPRSHGQSNRRRYSGYDFYNNPSSTEFSPENKGQTCRRRTVNRCSICEGDLIFDITLLNCTHMFHESCIENSSCPICSDATL